MRYFATVVELRKFLPDNLKHRTEQQWLDMSHDGAFAPHFFFTGQKEAWFRKSAVLRFCEKSFGRDHPHLIAEMKAAGFEPVQ